MISNTSTIIVRKPESTRTLGNLRHRYGNKVGKLGTQALCKGSDTLILLFPLGFHFVNTGFYYFKHGTDKYHYC
jgi:hypothetical protein